MSLEQFDQSGDDRYCHGEHAAQPDGQTIFQFTQIPFGCQFIAERIIEGFGHAGGLLTGKADGFQTARQFQGIKRRTAHIPMMTSLPVRVNQSNQCGER